MRVPRLFRRLLFSFFFFPVSPPSPSGEDAARSAQGIEIRMPLSWSSIFFSPLSATHPPRRARDLQRAKSCLPSFPFSFFIPVLPPLPVTLPPSRVGSPTQSGRTSPSFSLFSNPLSPSPPAAPMPRVPRPEATPSSSSLSLFPFWEPPSTDACE